MLSQTGLSVLLARRIQASQARSPVFIQTSQNKYCNELRASKPVHHLSSRYCHVRGPNAPKPKTGNTRPRALRMT
ncbi:protein of unknown function [Paraburkholderia kururiensis]